MSTWHKIDTASVLQGLGSRAEGLTESQARERLAEYGPNELEERATRSPLAVLAGQFTDAMVIVLMVAAVISFAIGETTDAIMILVIVILNAILGFTQEYRAERAMAALKRLAVPKVKVYRDGQLREVDSVQVVPGDIVVLEAGNRVPADGRVLASFSLRAEEAALTGESVPVDKMEKPIAEDNVSLGDRRNMVFMGTAITYGRGRVVVTDTGMRTELGHIATMLQAVGEEKTPLQRRMDELGKWLALGALVIVGIVFALGVWRGEPLTEMFLTAISLAVAAVPEGLPAVVTITLALGAQRMVQRHALIRRLPAVETLGSVTTICSDKTGTLTENRMTVTELDVAGESMSLVADLRSAGAFIAPGEAPLGRPKPDLAVLLAGGALANDATLEPDQDERGGYHAVGDPTEGAMVVAAARMGIWKAKMEQVFPRVAEAPFTSERKRMTTVHARPSQSECEGELAECLFRHLPDARYIAFTKGSVDGLLSLSTAVWQDGRAEAMNDEWRRRIAAANDRLAGEGVRVLGVAMRPLGEIAEPVSEEALESDLVFVGLTGMIDPPRSEVKKSVAECREAGIRPVMITGDHPLTALTIARELGIAKDGDGGERVITGQQLAEMSVDDLEAIVEEVAVYARVSPEHKVKIVEALKRRGHFVAMTGDGVNDAPALKRADIGVAMGITGTDVSKEASDMVLLDDNFSTIVNAIEEGRTIYENIHKFVKYIVSSNVGEIFVMLLAPLLGLPMPLTAVQLLWINLVTDGLPGLALGMEPADPDTMKRPPHPPNESVLARGTGSYILWIGLLLGAVCVAAEYLGQSMREGAWRTAVFSTLGLAQMGNALAVRSERKSLFQLGLLSNKYLLGAVLLTVLAQMAVVYVPFLQPIFGTTSLSLGQLGLVLAFSAIPFVVVEVGKLVARARARRVA
jgi:Ca2+-transporting ATPase